MCLPKKNNSSIKFKSRIFRIINQNNKMAKSKYYLFLITDNVYRTKSMI